MENTFTIFSFDGSAWTALELPTSYARMAIRPSLEWEFRDELREGCPAITGEQSYSCQNPRGSPCLGGIRSS